MRKPLVIVRREKVKTLPGSVAGGFLLPFAAVMALPLGRGNFPLDQR
jgi:hypothetical protein